MRKVVYVIDTLAVGGAERSTVNLAVSLQSFSAVVVAAYSGGPLERDLGARGVRLIKLGGETARYGISSKGAELARVIADIRPAVVHSTLFRSDMIARCARLSKGWHDDLPLVSSLVSDSYTHRLSGRRRLVQLADCVTSRATDLFIANSEAVRTRNTAALGLMPSQVDVVYRGRNLKRYFPVAVAPRNQVPRLITVGRLIATKRHSDLLRAFKIASAQIPCTLVIVGDGPERESLETLSHDLGLEGAVEFLGEREDVPEQLRMSDAFVFPSALEGFPGALVEAMATGLPSVVSNIAMNLEAGTHLDSLVAFELGDVADLASWIVRLLGDVSLRQSIGARARCVVEQRFDESATVRSTERLYERAIAIAGGGQ